MEAQDGWRDGRGGYFGSLRHLLGSDHALETLRLPMTKRSLPHLNVYTRLKPSAIHGVGVFAIRNIPKGTRLFDGNEEITWIDERQIAHLPQTLRKMYEDFCIIKDGRYGCPINFNSLTIGWYLNDS